MLLLECNVAQWEKSIQTSEDLVLMPVPTCVVVAGLPTLMMTFVPFCSQ